MNATNLPYLCSTVGFENTPWSGSYYPAECPQDWRLAYFMNDFRSVYLPHTDWYLRPKALQNIADEIDDEFELVIEWPPLLDGAATELALQALALLKRNIRTLVLNIDGINESVLARNVQIIGSQFTICLDSDDTPTEVMAKMVKKHNTDSVWHPAKQEHFTPAKHYQIIKTPCLPLREFKQLFGQLKTNIKSEGAVRVFLEPDPNSVQRAIESQTLLELMGLNQDFDQSLL